MGTNKGDKDLMIEKMEHFELAIKTALSASSGAVDVDECDTKENEQCLIPDASKARSVVTRGQPKSKHSTSTRAQSKGASEILDAKGDASPTKKKQRRRTIANDDVLANDGLGFAFAHIRSDKKRRASATMTEVDADAGCASVPCSAARAEVNANVACASVPCRPFRHATAGSRRRSDAQGPELALPVPRRRADTRGSAAESRKSTKGSASEARKGTKASASGTTLKRSCAPDDSSEHETAGGAAESRKSNKGSASEARKGIKASASSTTPKRSCAPDDNSEHEIAGGSTPARSRRRGRSKHTVGSSSGGVQSLEMADLSTARSPRQSLRTGERRRSKRGSIGNSEPLLTISA